MFFAEIQSLLVNVRDAHANSTRVVSTHVTFSIEHGVGQQATGNITGYVSGRRSCVQTCIGSRWASGPARTGHVVVIEMPMRVRKCVHECGEGQHRFYESSKLLRIEFRNLPIRVVATSMPALRVSILRARTHPDGACQALFLRACGWLVGCFVGWD